MPLKGKYLKYTPEITLEVFTLIHNKLMALGWNSMRIKDNYRYFTKNYPYLTNIGEYHFYTRDDKSSDLIGKTETTVQEILGYNPYVKDDFVLPEKLCIKTSENEEGKLTSEWAEIISLPEPKVESKEVIPEYVECIFGYEGQFTKGKIYKTTSTKSVYQYEVENCDNGLKNAWIKQNFKPSTKEAFDAQNKPKSIEKWSVGSYVVFLQDKVLTRSGRVTKGKAYMLMTGGELPYFRDDNSNLVNFSSNSFESYGLKWFATKSEAEEFAKTLIEPVNHGNGILDAMEPKKPLKQAVHCKTQEEWDFVTVKCGLKWVHHNFQKAKNICIIISSNTWTSVESLDKSDEYQILSFQEWCDLNNYKMEKEVKFEVGKWYKVTDGKCKSIGKDIWYAKSPRIVGGLIECEEYCHKQICGRGGNFGKIGYYTFTEVSIEEIQQYLPADHPDKIKPIIQEVKDMQEANQEFKVGDWVIRTVENGWPHNIGRMFQIAALYGDTVKDGRGNSFHMKKSIRHATQEEINKHLISIRQIPVEHICTNTNSHRHDGCGEKYGCIQNCDKCDYYQIPKDDDTIKLGLFEPSRFEKTDFKIGKIQSIPKTILSIDDEELPMVSIIKTNTIKKLLNND